MADDNEKLSLREVVQRAADAQREKDDDESESPETRAASIVPEGGPEEAGDAAAEEPAAEAAPTEKERDDKGRFKKGGKKDATAPERPELPTQSIVPREGEEQKPEVAAEPEKPAISPPRSWKPIAREKWKDLPREVQEEAFRVDLLLRKGASELAQLKKQAEESGKPWQQFQEVVRPYEGLLKAENAEPLQAVGRLLAMSQALRTSPAETRAEILADMVARFGRDLTQPTIKLQDGRTTNLLEMAFMRRLNGQGPQAIPQQNQPQVFQDPRLDALLKQLESGAQKRQQEAEAKRQQDEEEASRVLDQVEEGLEFFGDLRDEVDTILARWEAKGKTRIEGDDWETLYRMAAVMSDDVRPLYEQRQAAAAAERARPAVQRAKVAASSVRSTPAVGGPPPNGAGKRPSLREVVAQAVARQTERL